jgi:ligand-binding sensor domain-containing protein
MDEQLELRLRGRLLEEIAPVTGGYPHWVTSPAGRRANPPASPDRDRSGRLVAPGGWSTRRRSRGQVVWAIAVVALLLLALALVGVAGSRQLERTVPAPSAVVPAPSARTAADLGPQALSASGLELLAPGDGFHQAIVDVDGETIWLLAEGRLVRYVSTTGQAETWTVGDDLGFAATSMAAARDGGVWLVDAASGGRMVRSFDGESFQDVVEAPVAIAMLAEAPDGSLWAAVGDTDGAVWQWDGQRWVDHGGWLERAGLTTSGAVRAIAVDPAGFVWIGATNEVQRFDGQQWWSFGRADAIPLAYLGTSIAPLSDGTVLVATMSGLARFDGLSWSTIGPDVSPTRVATSIGIDSDGAVWVGREGSIARLDGESWTTFGAAQGLPDESAVAVAAVRDAVFAVTADGIYRLDGGSWDRAWSAPGNAPSPGWMGGLLPTARNEGWATDEAGIWHFLDGTWTLARPTSERAADLPAGDLARDADGTVWTAGAEGLLRLDGGRWTVVDPAPVSTLAAGPVGPFYVSGDAVRQVRLIDGHWTWDELPSPPFAPWTMTVAMDGTLWAGAFDWFGASAGLARFDGQTWQAVSIVGDSSPVIYDLVAADQDEVFAFISSEGSLGHFDGSTWTLQAGPAGLGDRFTRDLAADPDGSAWVTGDSGLHRFDGSRWDTYFEGVSFYDVAIANDGTGWAVGPGGLVRFDAS